MDALCVCVSAVLCLLVIFGAGLAYCILAYCGCSRISCCVSGTFGYCLGGACVYVLG